jgi:hypothetical protein
LIRKLILAAFMLPVFAAALVISSPASANADTKYDVASLTKTLLTADDITNILGGPPSSTDNKVIADDSTGVGVARRFTDDSDGDQIVIALFSLKSGDAPTGKDLDDLTNGSFLKDYAKSEFDKVDLFDNAPTDPGPATIAKFVGTKNGTDHAVLAISFIKGNVFGIVSYSKLADVDPMNLALIYGFQYGKLP